MSINYNKFLVVVLCWLQHEWTGSTDEVLPSHTIPAWNISRVAIFVFRLVSERELSQIYPSPRFHHHVKALYFFLGRSGARAGFVSHMSNISSSFSLWKITRFYSADIPFTFKADSCNVRFCLWSPHSSLDAVNHHLEHRDLSLSWLHVDERGSYSNLRVSLQVPCQWFKVDLAIWEHPRVDRQNIGTVPGLAAAVVSIVDFNAYYKECLSCRITDPLGWAI